MKEFLRLLFLVLIVLPLAVLFIGPLLTLAGLRGAQRIGPIVFNPGRQGALGRVGAIWLGLLAWLVVWGGLAVILIGSGLFTFGGVASPGLQAQATPVAPVVVPNTTPTPLPTPTPQAPATPTPTAPPATETPPPPQSPTPAPLPPTPTPTLPAATPPPSPLPTATATSLPTPIATLSIAQVGEAVTAVETANELLRSASIEPSIGNLAAMERFWQGRALAKAQAFAQDLYQRYMHPLEVTFIYLSPPVALGGNTPDTAFVISTEEWTYRGPRDTHTESFEFTYTLRRQAEGWVIFEYTYRNVPAALPLRGGNTVATPLTSTLVTTTTVITPAGP